MEERTVELETAVLAKELGLKQEIISFDYLKPNGEKVTVDYVVNNRDFRDSCVYAPTQSLLQKWLREVHNIHIVIHYDYSIIGGYIVTDIIKSIEPRFINQVNKKSKYKNYKTYEESLEIGLQEALKIIKIN